MKPNLLNGIANVYTFMSKSHMNTAEVPITAISKLHDYQPEAFYKKCMNQNMHELLISTTK